MTTAKDELIPACVNVRSGELIWARIEQLGTDLHGLRVDVATIRERLDGTAARIEQSLATLATSLTAAVGRSEARAADCHDEKYGFVRQRDFRDVKRVVDRVQTIIVTTVLMAILGALGLGVAQVSGFRLVRPEVVSGAGMPRGERPR